MVLSYVVLAVAFIALLKLPGILFSSLWHVARPLAMVGFGFLLGLSFPEQTEVSKGKSSAYRASDSSREQPQKWLESSAVHDTSSLGTILLNSAMGEVQTIAETVYESIDRYSDRVSITEVADYLSDSIRPERQARLERGKQVTRF